MSENLVDQESQVKLRFLKMQAERAFYLDEFKENIALALTEKELKSGYVYPEILEEMKKSTTAYIKLKKEISLKYLKPYILEAEKNRLRYTLVDGLNLLGDIGLVVVSKEAFETNEREIVVKSMEEKFEKNGLYVEYIKYFGEALCERHYRLLKDKMPEYVFQFKKLTFLDKLFGKGCPICKIEKEKNRKW